MKLLKTIVVIILTSLVSINLQAQSKEKLRLQKEIDSLNKTYSFSTTLNGYINHHYKLKTSKSINYQKGIFKSYIQLMWYHGVKRKLDSTLYYCNQFEVFEQSHPNKEIKIIYLHNRALLFNLYLGLTEEALNSYTTAYSLVSKDSLAEKIELNIAISQCYANKKQYSKAITVLNQCIKDTAKIKFKMKFILLETLATSYQFMNKPEKSFPIHQKMIALSKKNNDKLMEVYTQNGIIYDYYLQHQYQKGIDYGLKVREKFKIPDLSEYMFANSEFLANNYNAIGNYKNAIYFMKSAISETPAYNELPDLYSDLAKYYKSNNDLKEATEIYEKRDQVIDSIRSMEQKAFTDYYDTKIKFINQTENSKKIILENSVQKSYIVSLIIGIFCLLLFILSFVIYRKYNKSEKKIEDLKEKEKVILKNHIKLREDELSVILISEAKKNEKLDQIKIDLTHGVKNNDIKQIKIAEESLNEYLKSADEFNIFSERLESQYPGIVYQLKNSHPELSQNDIKHCLLVKLGLSLKESAQLLSVTTGTVKTARNRVVRKLDLPEDLNFKDYLDQIENSKLILGNKI
jgi:hypothetical protein